MYWPFEVATREARVKRHPENGQGLNTKLLQEADDTPTSAKLGNALLGRPAVYFYHDGDGRGTLVVILEVDVVLVVWASISSPPSLEN
jgi:hypothetical protein